MTATWTELRESWGALLAAMGARFLALTALVSHASKGFLCGGGSDGLLGTPLQFMLRAHGSLTASRIQVLRTIAVSPWALKPLFGMLSDAVPLVGFGKLPYCALVAVLAVLAALVMTTLGPLSPVGATLALFVLFAQVSLCDLLVEAKYAQKMQGKEAVGPKLTSFIHAGSALCQCASIVVCGVLLSLVPPTDYHYIYALAVPVPLVTLWMLYENWLDDEEYRYADARYTVDASGAHQLDTVQPNASRLRSLCGPLFRYHRADGREIPVVGLDAAKVREHWRMFLLCGIIGAISLLTSAIGLAGLPTLWLFVLSLLSACAMIGALFALLDDRRVALIQTYTVLQAVCNLSTGAADFFFFTDTAEQYPEGPHFSTFFYVTVMGVMGTLVYLAGVASYYFFMQHWRFRSVLYFSNTLLFLLSGLNIVLVNRWNVAAGVPDWLFVLGSEGLQTVTSAWASMPISLMMLQLCRPGVEATSYALLAGSINMGRALAQYMGAFALDAFGVRPTGAPGESAQFDNLWKVVLIAMMLPLIPLALIRFLIPDGEQTGKLLAQAEIEAEMEEMHVDSEENSV
jgi:hypothetical protein